MTTSLRIRPGLERNAEGQWRAIVRLDLTTEDYSETKVFEGEWLASEAEAEAKAREISRTVRAGVARNPRIRAE